MAACGHEITAGTPLDTSPRAITAKQGPPRHGSRPLIEGKIQPMGVWPDSGGAVKQRSGSGLGCQIAPRLQPIIRGKTIELLYNFGGRGKQK
jgi:hypothetical protein